MAQAGGVELDELHILQLQAGLQGERHAVTGQIPGVGGRMEESAGSARAQDDIVGLDGLQFAGVGVQDDQSTGLAAGFLISRRIHDQIGRLPFLSELDSQTQALLPQGVQDLVADTVGCIGCSPDWVATIIGGMAAKLPLGDVPVFSP